MSERAFHAGHLDVEAFARAAVGLDGQWTLQQLPRLRESVVADAAAAAQPAVSWHARGERRERPGAAAQVWLHLEATAPVVLQCQRCLQDMAHTVQLQRSFRFVPGEDEAARLDEEDDEVDYLALSPAFDLRALVEDELILALPLVPRHEQCPQPLVAPVDDLAAEHPFAALAALTPARRQ